MVEFYKLQGIAGILAGARATAIENGQEGIVQMLDMIRDQAIGQLAQNAEAIGLSEEQIAELRG